MAAKIPFDSNGNVISYVGSIPSSEIIYKDNSTFDAEIELIDIERGRSRVTFIFRDVATGVTYPMNLTQFKLLTKTGVRFTGRFTFKKRGSNYTLVCLDNEDEQQDDTESDAEAEQ